VEVPFLVLGLFLDHVQVPSRTSKVVVLLVASLSPHL
jgi:hypothetical protein